MSSDLNTGNIDHRAKRRMSNFLLNRRFQLKYVAMIVSVATAISVVLGLFLAEKVRENSRMLALDGELDQAFQEQLAQSDAQIIYALLASFVIANVVLAIATLVITHHMVGPIWVFTRYFGEIGSGKIPRIRSLRRGDEFQDLLDAIRLAVGTIETRARTDVDRLDQAIRSLEEGVGGTRDAHQVLSSMRDEKQRMLAEATMGQGDAATGDVSTGGTSTGDVTSS